MPKKVKENLHLKIRLEEDYNGSPEQTNKKSKQCHQKKGRFPKQACTHEKEQSSTTAKKCLQTQISESQESGLNGHTQDDYNLQIEGNERNCRRSNSDSGITMLNRFDAKGNDPISPDNDKSPLEREGRRRAFTFSGCSLQQDENALKQSAAPPMSFLMEKPSPSKYLYPSPVPIYPMEQSFPPVDF